MMVAAKARQLSHKLNLNGFLRPKSRNNPLKLNSNNYRVKNSNTNNNSLKIKVIRMISRRRGNLPINRKVIRLMTLLIDQRAVQLEVVAEAVEEAMVTKTMKEIIKIVVAVAAVEEAVVVAEAEEAAVILIGISNQKKANNLLMSNTFNRENLKKSSLKVMEAFLKLHKLVREVLIKIRTNSIARNKMLIKVKYMSLEVLALQPTT